MRPTFPSADQVRELKRLTEHRIPTDWQDTNGHVNIQYYQTLYEKAGWPMLARAGVDSDYFEQRRRGIFDLEHHIYYLRELHVGERVALYGRFLARNRKRLHGMMFIVNVNRDQLACTLEFVSTGANLDSRRSGEFPQDVLDKFDQLIAADSVLEWAAPVCGTMSV